MASDAPVGVFDSGMGGISVLAELRRQLPGERFLYYGDNLHAPYGTRTPEEVLSLSTGVFELLLARGVKAVVIACNTATSVAAAGLRAQYPELPIIGMEPALKPASLLRHGGRILVLATPMTLRLEKFRVLMTRWGEGAVPIPCPELVEMVERQQLPEARAYLQALYRREAAQGPVDAIVLGCTHYVFLRPLLREIVPAETAILDGNEGTARQLRRVLEARGLLSSREAGSVELDTSGDPETVLPMMRQLLAMAESF